MDYKRPAGGACPRIEGVRVKICGITIPGDARAAEEAGANAIGLIFVRSSTRFVTPEQAGLIRAQVSPLTAVVGVFRDAPLSEVRELAENLRLGAVQLHGSEPPEYAARLRKRVPVIKAFSFTPELTREELSSYPADAILLDGAVPGSGTRFDWSLAGELRGHPHLMLAGGLTARNVGAGVAALRPFAVDVSSGVESSPGFKDARLMQEFVAAARSPVPAPA